MKNLDVGRFFFNILSLTEWRTMEDIFIFSAPKNTKQLYFYEVYKETSSHPKMRLLHRNMLLPFMGLPCYEESEEEQADAPAGKTPILSTSDSSSSGNSSTDDSSDVSNEAPTDQRQQEATSHRNHRGRRKRRPPERYQAGQAVIQEYTFSVPASQVCIL